MKKIKNLFILVISCLTVLSCSEDDKTITVLLDNVERGTVLRTLNFTGTYNVFDPSSDFFIVDMTLEEQDPSGGKDLAEINLYQSFKDNTDDGTDNSKPETLLSTTPSSALGVTEVNLPQFDAKVTLIDALAASGLSVDDINGGDQFIYRLEAVMTDGRIYTNNTGGTVSGGSFFSSPFEYTATVKCVPVDPFAGTYTMKLSDSYADTWDGAFITVTVDGVATNYEPANGAATDTFEIIVPPGTTELSFLYVAGAFEGEHTYTISFTDGVNTVDEAAVDGPAPVPGTIFLNICL